MSSSMETNLLLSDMESGPKYFKDLKMQEWQEKTDKCPAQSIGGLCFISGEQCNYDGCFGRYWRE